MPHIVGLPSKTTTGKGFTARLSGEAYSSDDKGNAFWGKMYYYTEVLAKLSDSLLGKFSQYCSH
ncbi:MAG: hypothetical protein HQM08_06205 [Candidatus Riflebacteria bacterium]|nr:hypothetical protein [Candidatus Riflebacteria bacterium]